MRSPSELATVTQDRLGDYVVVHITGEVDMASGPMVERGLRAAVAQAHSTDATIVIELDDVTFFGSTGVNLLLAVNNDCRQHGVPLRLAVSCQHVLRPLQITGVDELFEISDTLTEATGEAGTG